MNIILMINKLWGVTHPHQAKLIIDQQSKHIKEPTNLEEQAIKLVCTIIGSQKTCLWTDHHTWWGGQTPEYELCFVRVLNIDACGQPLITPRNMLQPSALSSTCPLSPIDHL